MTIQHSSQHGKGTARGKETPRAVDIVEAFSRQASRVPEKRALEFDGSGLTYEELDRATDRLARLFMEKGVGASSRVAVAMPRGLGEFSCFLAILKAGGAFVPIDSSHPADRIRQVLEDAEPQIVIAPGSSPLRGAFPESIPLVELDDPFNLDPTYDGEKLELSCDPDRLAYILFTSGSTGRPKGVAIPRGGISNFICSASREPGMGESDRLAAISTTTFDMSELDFFLPLYVGATVVVADRMTALDPSRFRAFLEERAITIMQATPTTWRMLLDAGWKGGPGFRAFTGGEAIGAPLANRLLACCSELWNLYGPTETSVYSTVERIGLGVEKITVGLPIENTSVSVRGAESGGELERGETGEICIGGRGLAIGYYGRPDLTAERFPTDPVTGERYYRTGDLGRWLTDGRLECLGRMDHQVKIRGFRIEPSDIEAHLRAAPGVDDVIVVGHKRDEGDPLLVAYWVGSATREDLYRRAKAELPYYMVPSAYIRLDSFPLTTTGKVDRKVLPPPGEAARVEDEAGTAPRDDRESVVAAIWREALGLPFVPVDVDFFSLGGTSIRAVQVQNRIMEATGVDFPLSILYEHPTVEGIASRIGSAGSGMDAPIVSELARGADPIPWFGIMGIHLFDDIARSLAGSYGFLGVHVPFRYAPGRDEFPSVQEIARGYLDAIRERQPQGPYFLVGLCHGGVVAFEAAAQLEKEGQEVGLIVLLDAELPSARRTLPVKRALCALRDAVASPAKALRKLSGRSAGMAPSAARAIAEIDILDDPRAIDEDLARYEASEPSIKAEVLAFRATRGEIAPWHIVSDHMGWSGRSGRLECRDIASDHLGIVREPHARLVAEGMIEARRRVEARRRSGD